MVDILNIDFSHNDDRGELVQLVHGGYEQINILKSNKGVVRGGHYHKETHEAFYVVYGSVIVDSCVDDKQDRQIFREGDFFCIPPYVLHSMEFPENCFMVQMYSTCVDKGNGTMDIFREGE